VIRRFVVFPVISPQGGEKPQDRSEIKTSRNFRRKLADAHHRARYKTRDQRSLRGLGFTNNANHAVGIAAVLEFNHPPLFRHREQRLAKRRNSHPLSAEGESLSEIRCKLVSRIKLKQLGCLHPGYRSGGVRRAVQGVVVKQNDFAIHRHAGVNLHQHVGPSFGAEPKSRNRVLWRLKHPASMRADENRATEKWMGEKQAEPKDDHLFMITFSVA